MNRPGALSIAACLGAVSALAQMSRPNIIVILADDLGYGDIGAFGGAAIPTPNLDRMAAQGLRLTDFHANGSVCSPTRAALLTGCYPIRAGVPGVVEAANRNGPGLDTAFLTLPRLLKHAGYATALFGKWHLGYRPFENPVRHGFDEFRGFLSGNVDYQSHVDQEGYYDWHDGLDTVVEPGYLTRIITTRSLGFIARNRDRPFFLYLAHGAPHYPYQGPGDPAFRVVAPGRSQTHVPGQTEAEKLARHRAMTEDMDDQIGRLLDSLRATGLDRKTLVFFFSDNGPAGTAIGSAGALQGRKGSVLEGGHRVPALAWWPGTLAPGRNSGETLAGFDLMPTLAALAGIRVSGLDGTDVSRVLFAGDTLPGRTLFWSAGEDVSVRRENWKLDRVGKTVQLFDFAASTRETAQAAVDNPTVRNSLLAAIDAWQATVRQKPEVAWSFAPSGAILSPGEEAGKAFRSRSLAGPDYPGYLRLDGRRARQGRNLFGYFPRTRSEK